MRLVLLILVTLGGCAATSVPGDVTVTGKSTDASVPGYAGSSGCGYEYITVDATYQGDGYTALNAQDALESFVGLHAELLQWGASGERVNLRIALAPPESIVLVWSEETGCPASLALETAMTLTTDDGSVEEVLPVTLTYSGGGVVALQTWIALDQWVGAWEPAEGLDARWKSVDVEIVAEFEASQSVGEIALYAETSEGESQNWSMAFWPAYPVMSQN